MTFLDYDLVFGFLLSTHLFRFMDESPRWLLEAGQFAEARKTLVKVLRRRQKSQPLSVKRTNDLTVDGLDRLIDDIKTRGATVGYCRQ